MQYGSEQYGTVAYGGDIVVAAASSTLSINTSDSITIGDIDSQKITSNNIAVSVDATSSGVSTGFSAGTTLTFSHAVAAGATKLVVSAQIWQDIAGTGTVSGITFNSAAFTKAAEYRFTGTGMWLETWYLDNPSVGTYNIIVTISGNTDARKAASISLFNADPGFDTSASDGGFGTSAGSSIIPSLDGSIIIDSLQSFGGTNAVQTQTSYFEDTTGSINAASQYVIQSTKASTTMGWTWTTAGDFSHLSVSFIPKYATINTETDSSTIGESVTVNISGGSVFTISVTDTTTPGEVRTITNTQLGNINVTDTSTPGEVRTITNTQLGNISVTDTSTPGEVRTITNTQLGNINVTDTSTPGEVRTITNTQLGNISVTDTSTPGEVRTITNTQLGSINITDTSTPGESITISLTSSAFSISLTDSFTMWDGVPDNADTLNITEGITVNIPAPGNLTVSVTDTSTTGEVVTITNTQLGNISVTDTSTPGEVRTITNTQLGNISVTDGSTISETFSSLTTPLVIKTGDLQPIVDTTLEIPSFSDTNAYSSTDSQGTLNGGSGVGSLEQIAQSFPATGTSISSVSLYLSKLNSPTDNLVVNITSSIGGASLGSSSIVGSSLTGTLTSTPFVFASPISVTSGTKYFIQLSRDGARDTTNKYAFGRDGALLGPQATSILPGYGYQQKDTGVWMGELSSSDIYFTVSYTNQTQINLTVNISVTDTSTPGEVRTITNTQLGNISVTDTSTPGEVRTITNTQLGNINVTDSITAGDTVTISIGSPSTLSTPVADSSTIGETVTTAINPIIWKGYTWDARDGGTGSPGYGGWAAANATGPDGSGYVTLRVTNPTGVMPMGSEIVNRTTGLGYGTYIAVWEGRMDNFDKNIVLGGMFPYFGGSPFIEFDTGEVSMWDQSDPFGYGPTVVTVSQNAWYNNGLSRTHADAAIDSSTLHTAVLTWQAGKAIFDFYIGSGTGGTNLLHTEVTTNIPVPSTEAVVFNMWTYSGAAAVADDLDAPATTMVIRDFLFAPQLSISKTDSITIGDIVTASPGSAFTISVTDTSTPGEVRTITNTQLGNISVTDTSTPGEVRTITNTQLGSINITDTSTPGEVVTIYQEYRFISVTDTSTPGEVITVVAGSPGNLTVSVTDTSTPGELVTITNTQLGGISVTDTSTPGEVRTITNTQLGNISVTDTSTPGELVTITNTQLGNIIVTDTSTPGEVVTISPEYLFISVTDTSTSGELVTITNTQLGNISITDTSTPGEVLTITISQLGNVSVTDTSTPGEVRTITNTQLGNINVTDTSTPGESITISVGAPGAITISATDTITVGDEVGYHAIVETITIGEVITISVGGTFSISVTDTSTPGEVCTITNTQLGNISVTDTSTPGEVRTITNTQLGNISVTDTSTPGEVLTITISQLGNISITDTSTPGEVRTITNTQLGNISVTDSLTAGEVVTISVGTPGAFTINVTDTSTAGEVVTITNTQLGNISVTDTSTPGEVVTIYQEYRFISITDTSTPGESVTISVVGQTNLSTSVSDSETIGEAVTIFLQNLFISVLDDETIGENLTIYQLNRFISVSDSITTQEVVTADLTIQRSVSDSITMVEIKTISNGLGSISSTDTSTVSESLTRLMTSFINIYDALSIGESKTITRTSASAPNRILDLAAGSPGTSTIDLTWTAPSDDIDNPCASYDIRYNTVPVTAINWAACTQVTGEPIPSPSGTPEAFTVTGLTDNTTYYFGIKTTDSNGNISLLSNVPNATTLAILVVSLYDSIFAREIISKGSIRYSPGRRVHGNSSPEKLTYGTAGSKLDRF